MAASSVQLFLYRATAQIVFPVVLILLTGLILIPKWKCQYWKKRNVPYLKPRYIFGNTINPFQLKEKPGFIITKIYNEMKKRKWKHGGIYLFTSPIYVLIDLDYVKNVLTKDFEYFTDRGVYYNAKDDPVSAHLVNVGGKTWKNLRTKLNPTFTSNKVKMMFHLSLSCAQNLLTKMEEEYQKSKSVDIYEIIMCFTIDIIGSCAFGLNCNMFKNENVPYKFFASKAHEQSKFKILKSYFGSIFPDFCRKIGVRLYSKDTAGFFLKMTSDVVKLRDENNHRGQDFMQLLIDLKHGGSLSLEEMAAQCLIFFLAGYETSSSVMTMALYELSKHQDIQDKVRSEIGDVLAQHQDEITYEALHNLKYLNQVIDETMRKYPAVLFLTRKCSKDYKMKENVVIEKGTMVLIPVHAIHYDQQYYPDPEKFDPDRFSESNKKQRHHYSHLPFGEGPRICIGKRFGLIQVKLGLTVLLKNFKFTINKKTEEPLTMTMNTLILKPKTPIWLDLHKI